MGNTILDGVFKSDCIKQGELEGGKDFSAHLYLAYRGDIGRWKTGTDRCDPNCGLPLPGDRALQLI
jgi:hypothetical protein